MKYKEIEVLNEQTGKIMKCICAGYDRFLSDCHEFVQPRYRQFKCNPKNQFSKKVISVISKVMNEKHFLPDLFYVRLSKKQSICNCQIDYVFELLDRAFLENDKLRQNELDADVLEACLLPEIDYVMIYVGMNR